MCCEKFVRPKPLIVMSDSGENERRRTSRDGDEKELATRTIQIQSKRFYLDVKENRSGRFIKIAEVGADGRKSRIILAMSTAGEFCDHLNDFNDYTEDSKAVANPKDGVIKTSTIVRDNRRYYFDLKENQKGRFLRISMTSPRSFQRSQIAIPGSGLKEIGSTLKEIVEEYGKDYQESQKLESQMLRVENKLFYFDIGENRMGTYLRISEVRSNFRAAIAIPSHSWGRFRDVISQYVDASGQEDEKK